MMYDRILVTVDGSEESKNAGFKAVDLAKQLDATVVVTHIIDQRLSFTIDDLEDKGKEYINTVREYAADENVKSEDLLIYGSPKNDIMIIARKSEADMIVMSAHGNTKDKSSPMGGFTEFVLKNIDLPLLLF